MKKFDYHILIIVDKIINLFYFMNNKDFFIKNNKLQC